MLRLPAFGLALLALLASFPSSAQSTAAFQGDAALDSWDLKRCIDYALEHSLNVELGEIGMEQAAVDLRQSRLAQLPSLSANGNYGIGFGRATNQDNQIISASRTQSSTFSVNAGMNLYSGGSIRNGIRLSQSAAELAKLDRDATKNSVMLEVAQAYIGVLLAEEDLTRLEAQMAVSRENLANSQKLADAGVIPEGNLRDLEAQIASDEFALVNAQNSVNIAYLSLRLVMMAEEGTDFRVAKPDEATMSALLVEDDYNIESIFQYAAQNLPAYAGNTVAERIAELGINIARAGWRCQHHLVHHQRSGRGFSPRLRHPVGQQLWPERRRQPEHPHFQQRQQQSGRTQCGIGSAAHPSGQCPGTQHPAPVGPTSRRRCAEQCGHLPFGPKAAGSPGFSGGFCPKAL
jgi:outer membrane protein